MALNWLRLNWLRPSRADIFLIKYFSLVAGLMSGSFWKITWNLMVFLTLVKIICGKPNAASFFYQFWGRYKSWDEEHKPTSERRLAVRQESNYGLGNSPHRLEDTKTKIWQSIETDKLATVTPSLYHGNNCHVVVWNSLDHIWQWSWFLIGAVLQIYTSNMVIGLTTIIVIDLLYVHIK